MAPDLPAAPAAQAGRWRVFLDTNVLIAGLLSPAGPPAAILDLGEAEEIVLVVSRQVLVEADRVVGKKFPALLERYRLFIKNLRPLLVEDPPRQAVREAERVIHHDDAPILAAAKQAKVEYLVTGNTRHFASEKVRTFLPIPLLTPAEFLAAFRTFWEASS